MQYCNRCLYPANHPLGITFDKNGICSGCRVHDEKFKSIDWAKKASSFESLVSHYRSRPGSSYDCVIPVIGSGDDFYVVDLVKNRFGLNPLLVTYNTHFNTAVGVRNLARLITNLDCDHIHSTVGPETIKKITRETIRLLGDMYWHVLAGTLTFPVQVATKFGIPLIVWGCNGWLDQVGQFSHEDMVEMSRKVRKEHGLRMIDSEQMMERANGITFQDVLPYKYPSDEQLERSRVRGVYINNFFFWNSKKQTEWAIREHGYETQTEERTHNTYETIHCQNNAGIHDYIKFLKFGYGKATDHACRDIRLKRLTREEGIQLAEKYDGVRPAGLPDFLKWIEMTESELMSHIDRFRDPRVWRRNQMGIWERIGSVKVGTPNAPLTADDSTIELEEENEYLLTKQLEEKSKSYILTGRTYMDENNFKAVEG